MEALFSAVTAEAGASKMYCLFCGSGHVPSVTAVSRLTMLMFDPAKSWGMVVPRAVEGFWASFPPTTPSKWTSPPKPSVTVFPSPFQSGLSGEFLGKCWLASVATRADEDDVVVEVDAVGVPEPPENPAR